MFYMSGATIMKVLTCALKTVKTVRAEDVKRTNRRFRELGWCRVTPLSAIHQDCISSVSIDRTESMFTFEHVAV